ncbi:hypothetical protein BS78_05G271700 [Paspalum vaginatum]|uniref:DUF4220 domain-containing protein n=1 Tax=Paspalum vaginatum TaxID=158149 RepID=A0A9W7X6V7_9POAL|nr:hypothetical protein BS78_K080700 [Paspalum vaginatum]KAJ1277139.1 hypothetical protein BS78_05G271700 [Paspalum vaginatum]
MAPSPPPPCYHDNTTKVEVFVIVAVLGMFILHVLGSLRRRTSHGLLHATVSGVYTLSYPLVSYIIGWMTSSDCIYYDFAVWAVCLLLLLGNTDSLTVCRLNDLDNWKSIYIKHIFKGFMVVFIILAIALQDYLDTEHDMGYLWCPVFAILLVGVLKSYVRIASMRMASRSYLFKNVKVIHEYMMRHQDKKFDPVTMEGCRYMVAGEKYCIKQAWGMVTTVEQIWQYKGNLLLHGRGKMLKDVCLSMALSKMLNRRFAGFKLPEVELEKTKELVFKGLLAGDKPHQRAFRVIEEELVFVHDLYYTRYSYFQQKGRYFALCLPLMMFASCSWLTYRLVMNKSHNLGSTIFITAVLAFLEAYQMYLYIASGWFKVALMQSYVSMPFLKRWRFLEMILSLLLKLRAFRPWKYKLGQYCFLGKHGRRSRFRNCLHYATLRLVDKAEKWGRKGSVKLSENVKKAVIDSLLAESNGLLTSGATSLLNNCDATATGGGVTNTILVWHIATTLCWHKLDAQAKKEDAVMTADALSKYCSYLLAFAPQLLPDHCSVSESELILDQAIKEADKLLRKPKKLEERCRVLMEYSGDEAPLLTQGAKLARHLVQDIKDPALRWKVLSEFWAEMMLYISPSDDARAHLEALAKGGEFITHLWALLTHAGVLKRGPAEPNV